MELAIALVNGLDWDMEHGASTQLRLEADRAVWGRLVPYQLRMLQENGTNRFLPIAASEEGGKVVLHYDLGGRRRLVQWLYSDPPTIRKAVELAHLIAKTAAECKTFLLSESGLLLSEDFVYSGSRLTDFQLCYLPLEGIAEGRSLPAVTQQLRLLLLRIFAAVREPVPPAMAAVFGLLSQEPYSVVQLEQALRKVRYGGSGTEGQTDRGGQRPKEGKEPGRFALWGDRKGKRKAMAGIKVIQAEGGLSLSDPDNRIGKELDRKGSGLAGLARIRGWLRVATQKRMFDRAMMIRQPALAFPHGFHEKTGVLPDPAGKAESQPRLVMSDGKETRTLDLAGDRLLIGRNPESADLVIDGDGVSRIHCEISRTEGGWSATDLGSLNGTLLNGEPMLPYKRYPFGPGDVLQVIRTSIRFPD